MPIEELDPEVAWAAIEGYTNELDAEAKKLDAFYRQFVCLRCKGPCRKEVDPKHAFADPDTVVPRALLRCTACNCLFDPHTGLVLSLGDLSKTQLRPGEH